jgi:hypothetical protein
VWGEVGVPLAGCFLLHDLGRPVMRIWVALLTVAVACMFAVNAYAGEKKKEGKGKRMSAEERFKAMDTNNDEKLSPEEFVAGNKRVSKEEAEKLFKAWDTDGNGFLSLDEYKKGREKLREQFGKKKGEKKDEKK